MDEWCEELIDFIFSSKVVKELYGFYQETPERLTEEAFYKEFMKWASDRKPRLILLCKGYILHKMNNKNGLVKFYEKLKEMNYDTNAKHD